MVFGVDLSMSPKKALQPPLSGAAWLDAGDLDEQRRICTELQLQLWQDVPYIPMGEYWQPTAYRNDLADVLPGCFAVFWGIRRA